MQNSTRIKFNAYKQRQEQLNGVSDAAESFTVVPSVQQTLEKNIQESSAFLKKINIVPVDQITGEKLGLGVSGPIASRTDTTQKDRQTTDVSTLDGRKYLCAQTEYDTHVTWAKLDMWAKFPGFQNLLSQAIWQQCALDRIMVGFNGIAAADETNRATNPLLQDVNRGWLQELREAAPERVMKEGGTANKVIVGGSGGDYKTLDGLVFDAVENLIDPWFVEGGDLVAIVGRNLMHDKLFPIVDGQTAPTEMLAASLVVSQVRLGGLQAVRVPFIPANTMLITSLDNLSIYYQVQGRRRAVMDNPKRSRIETYESSNDAFVIEKLGKACLIENIEIAS